MDILQPLNGPKLNPKLNSAFKMQPHQDREMVTALDVIWQKPGLWLEGDDVSANLSTDMAEVLQMAPREGQRAGC